MFVYRDYRWRDLPALVADPRLPPAPSPWCSTLIACASSVGYVMALTQMLARSRRPSRPYRAKNVNLFLINIMLLTRSSGRHGAVDFDLHANFVAGDDQFRRQPGPFRHHHDAQSRHRAVSSPGRLILFVGCAVVRSGSSRRRENLAVLRGDAGGPNAGDLHSGDFAPAAATARRRASILHKFQQTDRRRLRFVCCAAMPGGHHVADSVPDTTKGALAGYPR